MLKNNYIPNKETVLAFLPIPDLKRKNIIISGTNKQLQERVLLNLPISKEQTKKTAYLFFNAPTAEEQAFKVYEFLRKNINFIPDGMHYQDVKLPSSLLKIGSGDCKSFTNFAFGNLSNLGFKCTVRFVSQKQNDKSPDHVYLIAEKNNKKFIIDGTINQFNKEVKYFYKYDYPMNISTITGPFIELNNSGINGRKRDNKTILTKQNFSSSKLEEAFNNKNGFIYENIPELREAVANYARTLINNLHKNKGVTGPFIGAGGKGKAKVKAAIKKPAQAVKKAVQTTAKAAPKVFQGVKKVTAAPPRNAFLALVEFNIHHIATDLSKANQPKLLKKWQQLGGNPSVLQKAILKGSKKKPILGPVNDGIGEPLTAATLAATLAAATPIIVILNEFISEGKKLKGNILPKNSEVMPVVLPPGNGSGVLANIDTKKPGPGEEPGNNYSPGPGPGEGPGPGNNYSPGSGEAPGPEEPPPPPPAENKNNWILPTAVIAVLILALK